MIPTRRTFWTMGILVMFVMSLSGCGQKHLSVSTSSGKANEQEELEASLQDTPSEETTIQDSSFSETGLGSELASQSSTGPETPMIEPLPLPSGQGAGAEESLEIPEISAPSTLAKLDEGTPQHSNSLDVEDSKDAEGVQTSSALQTGMGPSTDSGHSGNGASVMPFGATHTDQGNVPEEFSPGEELGALGQSTEDQGEPIESTQIDQVPEPIDVTKPEPIVVAKVEPSDAIEEQLARIKEDELATAAAGLQDVFFEFDSWKITEEGKDVLEKNANLLQDDAEKNLLIEGHCDQRGTQAYNIVLGKKRAVAIRDYLVALGVEPSRLSVITYGKEKPFCTDETEICYQENRRGHLIVQ